MENLKHGTIALIEDGTPVIGLATQENVNLSIRGNMKEVVARGAYPCMISMEGLNKEGDTYVIPQVHELLTPFSICSDNAINLILCCVTTRFRC